MYIYINYKGFAIGKVLEMLTYNVWKHYPRIIFEQVCLNIMAFVNINISFRFVGRRLPTISLMGTLKTLPHKESTD